MPQSITVELRQATSIPMILHVDGKKPVMKFWKAIRQAKALEKELEHLTQERDQLKRDKESLLDSMLKTAEEREKFRAELRDMKKLLEAERRSFRDQVRDQTEADLLLVSERIRARILRGDSVKPDDSQVKEQALLQQRLAQFNPLGQNEALGMLNRPLAPFGVNFQYL